MRTGCCCRRRGWQGTTSSQHRSQVPPCVLTYVPSPTPPSPAIAHALSSLSSFASLPLLAAPSYSLSLPSSCCSSHNFQRNLLNASPPSRTQRRSASFDHLTHTSPDLILLPAEPTLQSSFIPAKKASHIPRSSTEIDNILLVRILHESVAKNQNVSSLPTWFTPTLLHTPRRVRLYRHNSFGITTPKSKQLPPSPTVLPRGNY